MFTGERMSGGATFETGFEFADHTGEV